MNTVTPPFAKEKAPKKSMASGTLKGQIKRLLLKMAEAKKLESEIKKLKDDIAPELNELSATNGFDNGRLALPNLAIVSVKLNPPKLIWKRNDDSLNPADRQGLALLVPEKYVVEDVVATDIYNGVAKGDKALIKALEKAGVLAVQESRFEVKAA